MTRKITKNTTLSEVFQYAKAKEILAECDLPCLSCPMARYEMEELTLKLLAERFNINLETLLKSLNKACEEQ